MYTLIYTDSCFKCLVKYIVLTPGKAANLRATVHICTLQRLILLSYLHMKGIEDKTGCNQIHYTTCYSNMHTHSFNAPLVSWFPRIGTTIDKGTTLDFTNKILHGRVYVVLTTKQININKFFLIPTKPVCRLRQTKPAHLYRNQRKITGWIETGKKQRMMVQGRLLLCIYISALTLRMSTLIRKIIFDLPEWFMARPYIGILVETLKEYPQ